MASSYMGPPKQLKEHCIRSGRTRSEGDWNQAVDTPGWRGYQKGRFSPTAVIGRRWTHPAALCRFSLSTRVWEKTVDMAEERVPRKLTTILATGVEGYRQAMSC